jgi:hypothetical protein
VLVEFRFLIYTSIRDLYSYSGWGEQHFQWHSKKTIKHVGILLFIESIKVLCAFLILKVGGNEKQWGSGRSQMLGNGLGPWRSRFIYNLNTQLLNKNHISFSALSSKMNKRLL